MHISEGVLTPEVLVIGAAGAAVGLAIGLKRLKSEDIPKVALLTAAFFVASLIHVPVGPSSAHLILNGLLGVILGWQAFPAIFIGLTLQAVLFQFGGLTTLGINTLNMALPAVFAGWIVRFFLKGGRPGPLVLGMSGLMAACSIMLSALMVSLALAFSGQGLETIGKLIFIVHIPIAAIEAVITASVVGFLLKVKPEVIAGGQMNRGQSMKSRTGVATAVLLFLSLFAVPAHAHKVNVFAWYDGNKVELEAYFSSGVKAMSSPVIVTNEAGKEVFRGKTNDKGRLSFVPPGKGKYHVVLKAGMGHMAETDVEVDMAPAGKAAGAAVPATEETRPQTRAQVESVEPAGPVKRAVPAASLPASSSELKTCITPDEMEQMLDQRLRPIRKELMVLAEERDKIRMSDVISGLGYIMGLMGIALYISVKRKDNS